MNYKIKHFKIFEKKYEKHFIDYRDFNVVKKKKYIIEKISELPLQQLFKQTKLCELLWDFDAVSLYPSAMWDENSIYPRIETVYTFTKDMNDELVEKFDNQTFTRGSAIFQKK